MTEAAHRKVTIPFPPKATCIITELMQFVNPDHSLPLIELQDGKVKGKMYSYTRIFDVTPSEARRAKALVSPCGARCDHLP